jgi:hypothetical protein
MPQLGASRQSGHIIWSVTGSAVRSPSALLYLVMPKRLQYRFPESLPKLLAKLRSSVSAREAFARVAEMYYVASLEALELAVDERQA